MTLLSRKKHQITPQSTPLPKDAKSDGLGRFAVPFRRAARLFTPVTAILLLGTMVAAATASEGHSPKRSGWKASLKRSLHVDSKDTSWSRTAPYSQRASKTVPTSSGRASSSRVRQASAESELNETQSVLKRSTDSPRVVSNATTSRKVEWQPTRPSNRSLRLQSTRQTTKTASRTLQESRIAQNPSKPRGTIPDPFDALPRKRSNLAQEPAPFFDKKSSPPAFAPRGTTEDPFKDDPKAYNAPSQDQAPKFQPQEGFDADAEEDCQQALDRLKAQTIDQVTLKILADGKIGEDMPYECMLGTEAFEPRQWSNITYMWKASGLCHKPLYFEDEQLERYGHSMGPYVQPFASGAHFFATLPILPYKMGLKTPNECVYVLGHYRPGSCAPYLVNPLPFTWRAALFQAGAVAGAVAVIP